MADGGGSRTAIIVALIGTAGVIASALIAKGALDGHPDQPAPAASGSPTPSASPTTAPNTGTAPSADAKHAPADFATAVPHLLSPAPGATLDGFPRHTVFRWSPVNQATRYRLEVQYCQPGVTGCISYPDQITSDTSGAVDFIGEQPGRWRVTAFDASGNPSRTSEWSVFAYAS